MTCVSAGPALRVWHIAVRMATASGSIAARVYLAHRRLAIIDVDARSNQPMVRDRHVITFNGEIYNYQELRKHLIEERLSFTTSGDTEVSPAGLASLG
jgi:asparagine synthase (glutamine-hydrolysing)